MNCVCVHTRAGARAGGCWQARGTRQQSVTVSVRERWRAASKPEELAACLASGCVPCPPPPQALGRMFGFTLDTFSKMDTVLSLGLEPRVLADYKSFAADYFRWGGGAAQGNGYDCLGA